MLTGHISPFDEALSRPFLDEPTRKSGAFRNLLPRVSSTSESAVSSDEDDEDYESVLFESDEEDGGNGAAGEANQAQWGRGTSSCNPFDGYDDELIMANCGGGDSRHSNPAVVIISSWNTTNYSSSSMSSSSSSSISSSSPPTKTTSRKQDQSPFVAHHFDAPFDASCHLLLRRLNDYYYTNNR
jgi:hypothetical protein